MNIRQLRNPDHTPSALEIRQLRQKYAPDGRVEEQRDWCAEKAMTTARTWRNWENGSRTPDKAKLIIFLLTVKNENFFDDIY